MYKCLQKFQQTFLSLELKTVSTYIHVHVFSMNCRITTYTRQYVNMSTTTIALLSVSQRN